MYIFHYRIYFIFYQVQQARQSTGEELLCAAAPSGMTTPTASTSFAPPDNSSTRAQGGRALAVTEGKQDSTEAGTASFTTAYLPRFEFVKFWKINTA